MAQRISGRLLVPGGIVAGTLLFDKRITAVERHPTDGPLVLPGFVDTHVHGGGGGDAMQGPEGVRSLAAFHIKCGTTTLCPTTITNPLERVEAALRGIREVAEDGDPELPAIAGAHLEGPFISPDKLGAQPPFATEPLPDVVAALLDLDVIAIATLAPEVPGATSAAEAFARAGARVSIGHTACSFEQAATLTSAVRAAGGTVGFTHLYNAMSALAGRSPGAVGAALADRGAFAELILDGHHVHPASFLTAVNAKPGRLHLITDAIEAAGLGDCKAELGGQAVVVQGGAARLADGTLAGSVLTLDVALRNAVAAGLRLEQAASLLSEVPARYLGLSDRGRLEPGFQADLVVLDDDLRVLEVWRSGRRIVG